MFKKQMVLFTIALSLLATAAFAGGHEYQVTGPVLEVDASKIVVKKGKDNWEIARDASTKVEGDLAVGSKVTVYYTMAATSIEAKAAKKSKKSK
jgi:hypothetical protein